MFDKLCVPYTIFIEAQEEEAYAQYVAPERMCILPHQNQGLTVTRNYIWDYAAERGHQWYWTFDDNIEGLFRFNHNLKTPCGDGSILAAIENFSQRYDNLAIAGMNYFMFVKRKYVVPPYILNTRVYSNMLIRTFSKNKHGEPYRNVLFYNDDTDLCLRVLKDGWTTVLFNAFLVYKHTTMTVNGGMTDYYTKTNNRLEFVRELQDSHKDVVTLTKKWGRWHHQVDYSGFRQQLHRREGLNIPNRINNFGMVLQERKGLAWVNSE
jgi:GT2 family glycosyltransferase